MVTSGRGGRENISQRTYPAGMSVAAELPSRRRRRQRRLEFYLPVRVPAQTPGKGRRRLEDTTALTDY